MKPLESLHTTGFDWPSLMDIWTVASLQNYNTRLVVLSTLILGLSSGIVGSFLLLRKRSLMGDALSHACLPGIGLAFMVMVSLGGAGKALPGLLLGATLTGIIGVGIVLLIRNTTRIKDDAAMGIVLSVFFGLGVALLGMIQTMPGASAAGLEYFIYGKTASMVQSDFQVIIAAAGIVVFISILIFKETTLLCFDDGFAKAQGWPVHLLDSILLGLVTIVTVVGLQAVGLILIIAFLITPAAAARFWTHNHRSMVVIAALIGALSGWLGSSISALLPRLPAGAVIVLVAAVLFIFSMIFGTARGVYHRKVSQHRLKKKMGRQHLLRAVYEILEQDGPKENEQGPWNHPISFDKLVDKRSWSRQRLLRWVRVAKREDHIEQFDGTNLQLSESGFGEAARMTRNHRLWEIYLITHADIAPQHVDRDADTVEHVLHPEMVRSLERIMAEQGNKVLLPESPHTLDPEVAL